MGRLTDTTLISEITGSDFPAGFYEEWLSLWQRSSFSTPFQSPAWIVPWWRTFGQGRLSVICLYSDNRLIAVAPFYIYRLNETGQRQLTIIGTGNTDYQDITAEEQYRAQSAEIILTYITDHSSEWDLCYFSGLREDSSLLNSKINKGFVSELYQHDTSLVVSLPDSFEKYLSSLPVSFEKNIRGACNKINKSGTLSFQTADKDSLNEFFDELFILHEKSWIERSGEGVLKDFKIREFHKQVALNLLQCGALKFFRLKYNDRTIASIYSMMKSGTLYYYIGGFDPGMKKYSPGSLILLFIMEDLIKMNFREFDFLLGTEGYKYNWGAGNKAIYGMIIRKGFSE